MPRPDNAVIKLSYALESADWPCCEGCKYAEMDGCAKSIEAADASVYLADGYLRCGLWEASPAGDGA